MKLQCNFDALEALCVKMGAKAVWKSTAHDERIREHRKLLRTSGIRVTHRDIETNDEGLLTHDGVHVVIYIKDNMHASTTSPIENLKRLHLSDCGTIQSMKEQERFHRYISSERKDGLFWVDLADKRDAERKLLPCKNCLRKLNYKKFMQFYNRYDSEGQDKIVYGFDVGEFFEHYATSFSQATFYNDRNAPYSGYSKDHPKISREKREQCGWKCEACGVYLGVKEHQRLLHLHHIDGNKGNNKPSNLQCLCALCHKQQPMHSYVHVDDSDKHVIESLRREQGLV